MPTPQMSVIANLLYLFLFYFFQPLHMNKVLPNKGLAVAKPLINKTGQYFNLKQVKRQVATCKC